MGAPRKDERRFTQRSESRTMSPESCLFHVSEVPRGRWLVGHLWGFKQRPLDTMAAWRHQYGDLLRFRLGTTPFYLLSHPDLAEEVLHHRMTESS